MPVNMLKKDIPKGEKPTGCFPTVEPQLGKSQEEEDRETDLAIQEQEALWESQESGIVHWSGEHGQRYSD